MQILEVGSFEGASACWFLENTHPQSHLCLIDQFFNDTFYHNIDIASRVHHNYPTLLEGLSENILPTLQEKSFDLIYIDAGHTYDCVSVDIEYADVLIRPGGYIVLDDYDKVWPGVVDAANDFLKDYKDSYTIADKEGYTLWLQSL
jgi:predicted O-methyltransferase YrrM